MTDKITAIFTALRAGESLKNPATWKNRQMVVTAIGGILYLIPVFTKIPLDETSINYISNTIVILVGFVNMYLIPSTSTKVGLPCKKEDDSPCEHC